MSLCVVSILQVVQADDHRAWYGLNNLGVIGNADNALQDAVCVCNFGLCLVSWGLVQKLDRKTNEMETRTSVPQEFHKTQIVTSPALTQQTEMHLALINCQDRLFVFMNFSVSEDLI